MKMEDKKLSDYTMRDVAKVCLWFLLGGVVFFGVILLLGELLG